MKPWLKWMLASNLGVIAVLAFVQPTFMLSPGPVQKAHASLQADCFACHAPLRGASAERCTSCHVPKDIGRVTTTGQPLTRGTPFHQALVRQDCMACHREHADRLLANASAPIRFDHALLQPAHAQRCESCHQAPKTVMHRLTANRPCSQCHGTQAWTPTRFDHALLPATDRAQCAACHIKPADSLHAAVGKDCGSCHTTQAWTPATFDHDKYFPLKGDHKASCATCHPGNDTRRYTCYGCHAHTQVGIRAEHLEEGIRDFQQCTDCHGPRAKAMGRGDEGDD